MLTTPDLSGGVINTIFALLFAINLVAIFWGIVMYFVEMGSDHGKLEGKDLILKSVTYLFILMCIYAVVDWIRTSIGF